MATTRSKISFLSALILSSCTLVAYAQEREVKSASTLVSAPADCVLGEAKFIVSRDDRFKGSGIHSRILLDGKEIGEITRGQNVQYCISAGEHIVGVASDFFGGRGAHKRELAAEFKPDVSYAFRIFILHAQGATIERTAL